MKKLRSFTIIELMISLLISGIVISMSYFALRFFNRQSIRYRETSSMLGGFRLFSRAIQNDFDRSSLIMDTIAGRIMLYDEGKEDKIADYSFGPDFIVRNQHAATDTFFLHSLIVKIDHISDSLPLVKSLFLNTNMEGNTVESVFRKEYTGRELMVAEKFFYE